VAGCAVAAIPGVTAAQREAAARFLLRAHVGWLNQDDPLDFELAGGAEVGADFRNRWALVGRVVGQGEVSNPGRSGPVPRHRVVFAFGGEYAPAETGRRGEQFRIRLSSGAMVREGLATALVVAPGLLFHYGGASGSIGVAFAVEDLVTFLPTEYIQDCRRFSPCQLVPLDPKVEHNFGGWVGVQIRL
jgi:hypothetical protein